MSTRFLVQRSLAVLTAAVTVAFGLVACSGGHPSTASSPSVSLPHPLPLGFTASRNGDALPAAPAVLDVAQATSLQPERLHKAPLPQDQAVAIAQAIMNKAVSTTVRPLLVDQSTLQPGARVTVAAGDLGTSSEHDALFILQGPGGRSQRLVQVSSGVAAGVVRLPARMEPGTWALAAEDVSGLHFPPNEPPSGSVLLDLAIFVVSP